jgi:hypothetical protein
MRVQLINKVFYPQTFKAAPWRWRLARLLDDPRTRNRLIWLQDRAPAKPPSGTSVRDEQSQQQVPCEEFENWHYNSNVIDLDVTMETITVWWAGVELLPEWTDEVIVVGFDSWHKLSVSEDWVRMLARGRYWLPDGRVLPAGEWPNIGKAVK